MFNVRQGFKNASYFYCIIFFFSLSIEASSSTQRLACFFYDKNDPHEGVSAFRPGLASIWAKGLASEDIYVTGDMRDGFFKANNLKGKTWGWLGLRLVANYENSHALAAEFCKQGLKHAFPDTFHTKEIVQMATKSSFLSFNHSPVVFDHQGTLIKKIDKMVIFGDSLSDQGNLKNWLRIFPQPPYFAGRFSNGRIWPDYLGSMTGVAVQNWAIGGSVADFVDPEDYKKSIYERLKRRTKAIASSSVKEEIGRYEKKSMASSSMMDPDSTLYSVWIGGNDYIDIIETGKDADIFLDQPDDERIGSKVIIEKTTNNIIKSINKLYVLGARNFLVANIPDLGIIPRIQINKSYHKELNEDQRQKTFFLSKKMTEITISHNVMLKQKISDFMNEHHDCTVVFIDIFKSLNHASHAVSIEDGTSPFDYGLDYSLKEEICFEDESVFINKACYLAGGLLPDESQICLEPHRTLFWDTNHPSTVGHCLIASYIHHAAALRDMFAASSLRNYLDLCLPSE